MRVERCMQPSLFFSILLSAMPGELLCHCAGLLSVKRSLDWQAVGRHGGWRAQPLATLNKHWEVRGEGDEMRWENKWTRWKPKERKFALHLPHRFKTCETARCFLEAVRCNLTGYSWQRGSWRMPGGGSFGHGPSSPVLPPPWHMSGLSDTLCSFVRLDRRPFALELWQLSDTLVKGVDGCSCHFPERSLILNGEMHFTRLPSVIPADSGMEAAAFSLRKVKEMSPFYCDIWCVILSSFCCFNFLLATDWSFIHSSHMFCFFPFYCSFALSHFSVSLFILFFSHISSICS